MHRGAIIVTILVGLLSAPRAEAGSLAAVVERARQATVGILNEAADPSIAPRQAQISVRGTGIHLGDGYIVTARHVVERAERGSAEPGLPEEIRILTNELEEVSARLSSSSSFLDLVVYRVAEDAAGSLQASVGFSGLEPQAGDDVFTIGYPLGWGPAIAFGHVGNPGVFLPTVETRLVQADLSVCSGNSGGGLFNATGELLGVMHAIIQTELGKEAVGDQRCSRFAFAVPNTFARRIVDAIRKGEEPMFSRLGIRMNAVKDKGRWLITASEVSGPALAGGIKKGDVLLAIDGQTIRDPAHLKNYLMERTAPGQQVTMRIRRGEQQLDLSITLGRG